MTIAEIYKVRSHRAPTVCATILLLGVLAPSVVGVWYVPKDPATYWTYYLTVFEILTLLLGIVFGGWLLGSEYRQGTVKRLLASEPRRIRALATKGLVGAAAMSAVVGMVGAIGWLAARFVGSMNDVAVPWEGRTLLASLLTGLVVATVAFSLSAITRSDSYAWVGTLAMMLVVEPLLSAVPEVAKYTFGSALDRLAEFIGGTHSLPPGGLSTAAAVVVLTSWLGTFVQLGGTLFAQRDV